MFDPTPHTGIAIILYAFYHTWQRWLWNGLEIVVAVSDKVPPRPEAFFSEDGKSRIEDSARFDVGDMQAPLDLARRLLDTAPPEVTRLFDGPA